MSDQREILTILMTELATAFRPLREATASDAEFRMFMKRLGWLVDEIPQPIQDIADGALMLLETSLEVAEDADFGYEEVLALVRAVEQIIDAIGELENGDFDPALMAENFAQEFPIQLLDYLTCEYLRISLPTTHAFLRLIGVIEVNSSGGSGNRPVFLKYTLNLNHFCRFFTEPEALLENLYGWGTNELNSGMLLSRTLDILNALGVPASLGPAEESTTSQLDGPSVIRSAEWPLRLDIPLFDTFRDGVWVRVNLWVVPIQATETAQPGLALLPEFAGGMRVDIELSENLHLRLEASLDMDGGVVLKIRPKNNPELLAGFGNETGLSTISGETSVILSYGSLQENPAFRVGPEDGSKLEIKEISLKTGIIMSKKQDFELFSEAALKGGLLAFTTKGADGFLLKILSAHLEAPFDLTLGIGTERGIYIEGSGGLELTATVHLDLGLITLKSIYLGLFTDIGEHTQLEGRVGLTLVTAIGPINATIKRIGFKTLLKSDENGKGNFGPFDFIFDFLPPTGAGFAISAPGIAGGGFLEFDTENERYSGILALQLSEIGITAIGLITTRLPDGSQGFSMLVSICVTFEPPIQIYMGFTLVGVGGLIGVNRAMKTDVLREGLKKGTLDSILFPDPASVIANADQIISDMRAVFPPEEGRFVIGPMVTFGWGTPTVVTGELGIFLSIPEPVSVALLGQIEMALPDREAEIVGIHIDILGVLDFEKKELSFQASIFNSRFALFKLTGDCAFFLRWGARQEFALALGGFHPSFTPPPPRIVFSDLKRLGVTIQYGPVLELQLQGYLALTPNSLQFGSRIQVFVGIPDISVGISGFLSFDGLINFSPFAFEANMGGGVSISVLDFHFADIRISSTLSGPTPWNVRGTATVNVLGVDVNCDFGFTWGDQNPAIQEAVAVWPRLKESLERVESWGSRLPAGTSMVEVLRPMEFESAAAQNGDTPELDPILVHPTSTFEVRQNVAPLELTLEKIGHAPIEDYNRFSIKNIQTKNADNADNADRLDVTPVDEYFSRGMYVNLTNQQKLSSPSFEKLPGGVTSAASNRVEFAEGRHSKVLGYESILIKSDRTTHPSINPAAASLDWSKRGRILAAGNAARRSALHNAGSAKFAVGGDSMVATQEEKSVVVDAETLIPIDLDSEVDVPDSGMTRTQAEQALDQQIALHPEQAGKCIVVAEFEAEPRVSPFAAPQRAIGDSLISSILEDYGPMEPL